MRLSNFLLFISLVLLTACQNNTSDDAQENAHEAVLSSMNQFKNAQSFHAELVVQRGGQSITRQMDFVSPDRYRIYMPEGAQTIIGSTLYLDIPGQAMQQVPLSEKMLEEWRNPLKLSVEDSGLLQVKYIGQENIQGQQAKHYQIRLQDIHSDDMDYWIDATGFPLQLIYIHLASGQGYTSTIHYSRFNDPTINIPLPE